MAPKQVAIRRAQALAKLKAEAIRISEESGVPPPDLESIWHQGGSEVIAMREMEALADWMASLNAPTARRRRQGRQEQTSGAAQGDEAQSTEAAESSAAPADEEQATPVATGSGESEGQGGGNPAPAAGHSVDVRAPALVGAPDVPAHRPLPPPVIDDAAPEF